MTSDLIITNMNHVGQDYALILPFVRILKRCCKTLSAAVQIKFDGSKVKDLGTDALTDDDGC